MRNQIRGCFLLCAVLVAGCQRANEQAREKAQVQTAQTPTAVHRLYEAYPSALAASIQRHEQQFARLPKGPAAGELFVIREKSHLWPQGRPVTVAFNGGDTTLYAKIENIASQWTAPGFANLKFSFRDASGHYRQWSSSDTTYVADVRISFSAAGYWSLVGLDSIDQSVGATPNAASMNFQGFDQALPADWQGIVLHEFGHALGFAHEHQGPAAPCDFRLNDDPGYQKTLDTDGWYTTDSSGRRPGLYTYLGGKANYWPRQEVDNNLGHLPDSSAFSVGPFDKFSIMKYYFDASMFLSGKNSPCYTGAENSVISSQDKVGVSRAYPALATQVANARVDRLATLQRVLDLPALDPAFRKSLEMRARLLSH